MEQRGRQLRAKVFDFPGLPAERRKPARAETSPAAAARSSAPEQDGVTPAAAGSRRPGGHPTTVPAPLPRGRAGDVDEQLAALQARIAELKKGGLASSQAPNSVAELQAGDSRGALGSQEFARLAAAAAQLALRATRLRAAARKADAAFVEASKVLDRRIMEARRTGVDLDDADTDEALEAAAAADAAEAAAVAAEERAIAMDEAARAQLAMAHAPAPLPLREGGDVTAPRHRHGQPAGAVSQYPGRPSRVRGHSGTHETEETPAPSVFRARPVPRSTREPLFERLLNESDLARQQRKAEARQRLAAAEKPFSFWGREQSAPRTAPSRPAPRSFVAETQLQSALSRLHDGAAKAELALTHMPV